MNLLCSDGFTALMTAAEGGTLTCIQLLVDSGADVHAVDQDGRTAIMWAAEGGHQKCIEFLEENGAVSPLNSLNTLFPFSF